MRPVRLMVLWLIGTLGSGHATAQVPANLLLIKVAPKPTVFRMAGQSVAYYELRLTSTSADTLRLTSLTITSPDSVVRVVWDKAALAARFGRMSASRPDAPPMILPTSEAVVYVELAWASSKPTRTLTHRLTLRRSGTLATTEEISTHATVLTAKAPLVLGAPLRGTWAAVYSPEWERGHRRVFYAVDGQARIPGRFAIDFIQLDAQGNYASANADSTKRWYGYGQPVLAVADGVVTKARDDFTESPTLSGHPKYTAEQATGNYIALAMGNNRYIFYEHLKPGSLRVRLGQRVKKGQVIAAVGFTGQTTGPHLHLHMADADSPLGAEGIPFVFDRFTLLGTYPDFGQFGKQPWKPIATPANSIRRQERPAPNVVIQF